MNTKLFRTKTEFLQRDNGCIQGLWEVALDIGYSAVKEFSPNSISAFPSYATRIDKNFSYVTSAPKESIVYRDLDNDEMWLVGAIAQNTKESGDTSDSEISLYGRDRYWNPMFKVLVRVGLGLGLTKNQYGYPGNSTIVVQSGLPARYMSDASYLKDIIAGKHNFALRIGDGEWQMFHPEIDPENVYIMEQPKGSLFSSVIRKDGLMTPDAGAIMNSNFIIFDPGFGTFDLYMSKSGRPHCETNQYLGMQRVLQETARLMKEEYGVEILVPEMQKYLETGSVPYIDRKTMVSGLHPIDKCLAKANHMVFEEMFEWMNDVVGAVTAYSYLIVTGGTSAAWEK